MNKIVVFSAHSGSFAWTSMISYLRETYHIDISEFYEFDDATYRSASSSLSKFFLRIRTYIVYPFRVFLYLSFRRRTKFIALFVSSPFYLPFVSLLPFTSRSSTICLLNDLYPEALVSHGILSTQSLTYMLIELYPFILRTHIGWFLYLQVTKSFF